MSKLQRGIFEMVVGLFGFGLFWYATNWMAAVGFFIAMFANNVGHPTHTHFQTKKGE